MGNTIHKLRRGTKELRQSLDLSEAFSTIQQKKGDRYINTFIFTFALSMLISFYNFKIQYQIEKDYLEYRGKVTQKLI